MIRYQRTIGHGVSQGGRYVSLGIRIQRNQFGCNHRHLDSFGTANKVSQKRLGLVQEQSQAALDTARAGSYAGLREMVLKINEVFLQWPEIRKYFYDGVSLNNNDPSYPRAEAAAELILDIMEHMLWQSAAFPYLYGIPEQDGKSSIRFTSTTSQEGSTFWDNYIIDMFISSPLLVAYAQKRRSWYLMGLIERMERAQRILSQSNDN